MDYGSLFQTHYLREIEIALERLRQGKLPPHSKRLTKQALRVFNESPKDTLMTNTDDLVFINCPKPGKKDAFLVDAMEKSNHLCQEFNCCVKKHEIQMGLSTLAAPGNMPAKDRREIFGTALNKPSLIIQGKNFKCLRLIKQRSTSKSPKAIDKEKPASHDSLEELRNDTLPVQSGSFFGPWSKEKRKRTKHNGDVQGRQKPRNEAFNLHALLAETKEIEKVCYANQNNGEFISLAEPCRVSSFTEQDSRLPSNQESHENVCVGADQMCKSARTDDNTDEQYLSEKFLRRKLMSY